MKIETKFNVGDEVYFIYHNKCVCAKICNLLIKVLSEIHITYIIRIDEDDKSFPEWLIFATKEELINSL